jgi:hypothetical protein
MPLHLIHGIRAMHMISSSQMPLLTSAGQRKRVGPREQLTKSSLFYCIHEYYSPANTSSITDCWLSTSSYNICVLRKRDQNQSLFLVFWTPFSLNILACLELSKLYLKSGFSLLLFCVIWFSNFHACPVPLLRFRSKMNMFTHLHKLGTCS